MLRGLPLEFAAQQGRYTCVFILLENGAKLWATEIPTEHDAAKESSNRDESTEVDCQPAEKSF